MKKFLQIFTDNHDRFSHKRVIAVGVFLVLSVMGFCSCICKCTFDETVISGLITMACVAMGSTAVEKFTKTTKNTNDEPPV